MQCARRRFWVEVEVTGDLRLRSLRMSADSTPAEAPI